MKTYKIIRFFKEHELHDREVLCTGRTLEEAQEHCKCDESSSRTCPYTALEDEKGAWFDGYEEEE